MRHHRRHCWALGDSRVRQTNLSDSVALLIPHTRAVHTCTRIVATPPCQEGQKGCLMGDAYSHTPGQDILPKRNRVDETQMSRDMTFLLAQACGAVVDRNVRRHSQHCSSFILSFHLCLAYRRIYVLVRAHSTAGTRNPAEPRVQQLFRLRHFAQRQVSGAPRVLCRMGFLIAPSDCPRGG